MTFQKLIDEKENWVGGKFQTSELGDNSYRNMVITGMEIKNDIFYVYSGNCSVSATTINNQPFSNEREDIVSFNIPYIGCCVLIRNKNGV